MPDMAFTGPRSPKNLSLPAMISAPLSQRYCMPLAQDGQRPHDGMNEAAT